MLEREREKREKMSRVAIDMYRPINIQTREKNRPINKYNKKEINLLILHFFLHFIV